MRFPVPATLVALALSAGAFSSAPAALAQTAPDLGSGGIQLSREELEARLDSYEQTAESSAYSSDLRSIAQEEAELIRTRLERGDFRTGDQISLYVEGEEQLTETFTVSPERTLELPSIGSIALDGVLRSELEPYLEKEISRYIRNPVVRARALFRVTISGAVGNPGFYVVPAEEPLTDALMAAGGPANTAKLTAIRIERGGREIWEGDELQQAITEGRTLDELSLSAGDHIIVPEKSGGIGRMVLYGMSAVSTVVLLLTRIF